MEIEKAKYATVGKYLLVQSLGSGFNSKVKLGVHMETNQRCAVKILKDVYNKFISNEIETLSKINHPNIVNLLEFLPNADYIKKNGTTKKVTAIVLELAPGGEVFEFLFRTGRFSEPVARFYFHNLMDSLGYIHDQGYSHRDLKPENLLFGGEFQLKLADFGFSTLISGKDGKGLLHTYLGTKGYMAPEIIAKQAYNGVSVDIFAAGVILFILFSGIPPFGEAHPNDPYYKLLSNKKYDYFWHAHSRNKPAGFFSVEFKDLIQAMLSLAPAERPTVEQIKTHAWYVAEVPKFEDVQTEMKARFVKVQEGVEKEREEKKIIAARKKAALDAKKPTGILTSYPAAKGTRDNLSVDIFKNIETEFANLSLERKSAVYEPAVTDYLCPDNINDAMIALLYVLKSKECSDIKVADNAFKVTAKHSEEDGENVQFNVRIFKNDDQTSYIRFERKDGNSYKFHELVDSLEKELNTVTKI